MTKRAIIDGDVLVFRAALRAEKVFDWGEDLYSYVGDLAEAIQHYDNMVKSIMKSTGADVPVVLFSDPSGSNFRKDIYPDYKKQRRKFGVRKPLLYVPLRDRVMGEGLYQKTYKNLEGDDAIGIAATVRKLSSRRSNIICTIDKDLKTIPGLHFNFDHPERGVYTISEEEANQFFFQQILAGDVTDGIPGIPGVGMKTAKKILDADGYTWDTVVKAYAKKDLGEDYALTMARLVYILRAGDYDYSFSYPHLWTP